MLRALNIRHRSLPLDAPFRISRGAKTSAEVVMVELTEAGRIGRGECVPYERYGESIESVVGQLESVRDEVCAGMDRGALQARLVAGAARNALDTALWDLESRLTGVPVWTRLAQPAPAPMVTALTVGIDTPERMGENAARIAHHGLIKVKLDAEAPAARIEAVRRVAPHPRLIVDANESWDIAILRDMQPALECHRVDLIEQPLPADADDALRDFVARIPVCADEACHTTDDLPRLRDRYQAVNIKLDKTGGLTEAWRLLHAARAEGFGIMVGCMVGSSLGIAPALEVAREADFVDLDGPFWLRDDYPDGIRMRGGLLHPPQAGFWGTRGATHD